jgi:predicted alpha/beta hydrolase family esterase
LGDIKKCYHFYQQGIIVAHSLSCHHAIGKVLKESSQAVIHKIVRESKE